MIEAEVQKWSRGRHIPAKTKKKRRAPGSASIRIAAPYADLFNGQIGCREFPLIHIRKEKAPPGRFGREAPFFCELCLEAEGNFRDRPIIAHAVAPDIGFESRGQRKIAMAEADPATHLGP